MALIIKWASILSVASLIVLLHLQKIFYSKY